MENMQKFPEFLGWSLYMSGGWQSQFKRVKRWYQRAQNTSNSIDRLDFLYTFFENAFHLRDWLIYTNSVSRDELNKLFRENESMSLCRDLANSHKHYAINSPSQPIPPSEIREYTTQNGNLGSNYSLIIISDGKKIDAFLLAGKIMQTWEHFIKLKLQKEEGDIE
ncbi:MAG: hypothetical protein GYA45_07735 [Pelolinea sp.]|jgi:hypothetical protein|nr:hypothetical protein [Pelolinea sp.]